MKLHLLSLTALCFAAFASAQNKDDHPEPPKPEKFYKVQLQVEQMDSGRPIKSQELSMTLPLGRRLSNIRSGEKIPYYNGSAQASQVGYQDVGVNIDFFDLEETAAGLSLSLKVEVSAAVGAEPGKLPLLRQYSWSSDVLVPVRKSTTVYSDSDSNSQYKMEVKVTATPLDLH